MLVFAALGDLLLFSHATILTLIALGIGAAMILLGILNSYKPASVVGLIIVAIGAAGSMQLSTLLEIGAILTALIGLAVPLLLLTWTALSVEEEEPKEAFITKTPLIAALTYALLCLWTPSLVLLVMGFAIPTVSMRATATTEIAIMLVAVIIGGMILTRRKPSVSGILRTAEKT